MGPTKLKPTVSERTEEPQLLVPPRIIARVVEVTADPDSSAADLSSLIGKDPTLTTQMLRTVNSAYYGLRQRVETVHHAVAFMGSRAVRNLILCIGLQQLVRREEIAGFPFEMFWECSIRRAAAAGCLARRLGFSHADEFFTVGLCLDIGVLVKLRSDPSFAVEYAALMDEPASARLQLEQEHGKTHDEVGAQLFEQWRLPDSQATCVRFHHRPDEAPEVVRRRCHAALAAESVADLLQVRDTTRPLEEVRQRFESLGLAPDLLRAVIDEVVDDVAKAADMLQLHVGTQLRYDEIVSKASDALLSLSMSQASTAIEAAGHAADVKSQTAELRRENEKLARQAATDPLTGLANRRLLDETLKRELAQASRQGSFLSFLLLDIDLFKKFNDTYGHQVGDLVLCRVAETLHQLSRRSDLCARFGGEEFAIVLPFTPETGAQEVAKRVREAVRKMTAEWLSNRLPVTISVGGVTIDGSNPVPRAEDLIKLADAAMYRAKREGRDRVCWAESVLDSDA